MNRTLLVDKIISKFNFNRTAASLITSYLVGRLQCVSNDNASSDFLSATSGVPQPSVLGPLLFTIFINGLPDILMHMSYHIFADDVQPYLRYSFDDVLHATELLNWAAMLRYNSIIEYVERITIEVMRRI